MRAISVSAAYRLLITLILVSQTFFATPMLAYPASAGTGPLVGIPPSNTVSVVDGLCSVAEYSDANEVTIENGPSILLKHTTDYLYACMSSAQAPDTPQGSLAVYVDVDHDGGGPDESDFALVVPYEGTPRAGYWNPTSSAYDGANPAGWKVQIYKYSFNNEFHKWNVEIEMHRKTVGGWQREIGLAFFYHSYQYVGVDQAWPSGSDIRNPDTWGNGKLLTGEVTIGQGTKVPIVDGDCQSGLEYSDGTSLSMPGRQGVIVYLKHSETDLYVCMHAGPDDNIPVVSLRDAPNAAVYIGRAVPGGDAPGPDDSAFTISYSGIVRANRGDGVGFAGPDPGGYSIARKLFEETEIVSVKPRIVITHRWWNAEWRISKETLRSGWDRKIVIAFALQSMSSSGDYYGWPIASSPYIPNTWGVGTLTTAASGTGFDMKPVAIEVTQSIQSLDNRVPLVAEKRTFVRVHYNANENRSGVTARLFVYHSGLATGYRLSPVIRGDATNVVTAPDRANLQDSFYFELPVDFTQAGRLSMTAEVNPFHEVEESSYENNLISTSVVFEPSNPLFVRLYNYQYRDANGKLVSSKDIDINLLESQIRRMLPISRLVSQRRVFYDENIDNVPTSNYVNGKLAAHRATYDGNAAGWKYYGLVYDRGDWDFFMQGSASGIPGSVASGPAGTPRDDFAWDRDSSYADWYGTHEISHMLGRKHVLCRGDEEGTDSSYPYPGGIIGGPEKDTKRFYGFDAGDAFLSLKKQVVPTTWTDNMSYCDNEWISDYTYTGILRYMQKQPQPNAAAGLVGKNATVFSYVSGDFLSIFGTIDRAKQSVQISHLSRQAEVAEIPPIVPGPYHIRLVGPKGTLLADIPFTPIPDSEDANLFYMQQIVEWKLGTQRIEIFSANAGVVIGSIPVSANAPSVSGLAHTGGSPLPANGPVTVTWSGSDPDGNNLVYTLLYSRDNRATWRTVAIGMKGNSFTFDMSQLEGTSGASQGWFRVIANDGVLTSDADDGPFTVEGKPPAVSIVDPVDQAVYQYGQTLVFEGYGQDFEDGTMDDPALSWSSNLDGPLGKGHLVNPKLLSVGRHVITLTVTDTDGMAASASITVLVEDRVSRPEQQLEINQDSFLFIDQAGGSNPKPQQLSIRNLGTGTLNWNAETNVPWITLDHNSGSAPTDVSISIDTSAFAPGTTQYGRITIRSQNEPDSFQEIMVVVQMIGAPATRLYLPLINKFK